MKVTSLALASFFSALSLVSGACGSTPADPKPDAPGPLARDETSAACSEAVLAHHCQLATSAEGDLFVSCECAAVSTTADLARLTITGVDVDNAKVEADYQLVREGTGWVLGKLLVNRGTPLSADALGGPGAQGPSTPGGKMCGGIANIRCDEDQFCDTGSHCGRGDQSGICTTRPQICTRDYRPVCGCDAKTYGNRCSAHAAGVSVAAEGPCK